MRDPVRLLNFPFVLTAAASACPKAWTAWKRFSARGPSPKTGTAKLSLRRSWLSIGGFRMSALGADMEGFALAKALRSG